VWAQASQVMNTQIHIFTVITSLLNKLKDIDFVAIEGHVRNPVTFE